MGRLLSFSLPSLAALAVVATPQAAWAEDYPGELAAREGAVALEPLAPWNLDFGENKCRLVRWFGTAEEPHMVMIEQAAPRAAFGLTLAGSEIRPFHNASSISIGMERDEPLERRERYGRGNVEQVGKALIFPSYFIGPSREAGAPLAAGIDVEEAGTIDRIVIERRNRVLSFETGNMGKPIEALNICTGDLLSDWGLDPEQHKSYVPPRWTNQDAIVRRIQASYPREALSRGEQAVFRMRVIVEEDGSVSDCHLENSTEVDRLNSPACRSMMDARFEPARTADGTTMRSFHASTISYTIGR